MIIFVTEDGDPISQHEQNAITEILNRIRRRVDIDLAIALDAGRLFEVADWVRDHIGAQEGDQVYGVSRGILSAVAKQTQADAAARAEYERQQRQALTGWAA